MSAVLKKFVREEEGAALVEYGLLVGLIALACVTALTTLGGNLADMFSNIAARLKDVVTAPAT